MSKAEEALPTALRFAGGLLIATGVLHCVAWIISGWSDLAAMLIPIGVLYLALGAGLHFRVPKIRYPALLVTLVGVLGVYITMDAAHVAEWLMWIFIVLDLGVIILLAASIWRGRQGG